MAPPSSLPSAKSSNMSLACTCATRQTAQSTAAFSKPSSPSAPSSWSGCFGPASQKTTGPCPYRARRTDDVAFSRFVFDYLPFRAGTPRRSVRRLGVIGQDFLCFDGSTARRAFLRDERPVKKPGRGYLIPPTTFCTKIEDELLTLICNGFHGADRHIITKILGHQKENIKDPALRDMPCAGLAARYISFVTCRSGRDGCDDTDDFDSFQNPGELAAPCLCAHCPPAAGASRPHLRRPPARARVNIDQVAEPPRHLTFPVQPRRLPTLFCGPRLPCPHPA